MYIENKLVMYPKLIRKWWIAAYLIDLFYLKWIMASLLVMFWLQKIFVTSVIPTNLLTVLLAYI